MPQVAAMTIEMVVSVLVLWMLTFLSTFLHELGHALGYMLSTGGRRWHIRVGFGKKLLETKALTVKLLVFDGCFEPIESRIDSKAKLISTLSGGPAVSLILAAGMLFLKLRGVSLDSVIIATGAIEFLINYALHLNAFIFVLAIIPVHYFWGEIKGMETDGRAIINAVKSKKDP